MQENILLEKLSTIENLLKKQTEKPLSFIEAAKYLDISKSYLYQLSCKNRIPHYKPQGKRIYFTKSDLDKWLLRNPVKIEDQPETTDNSTNNKIIN